MVKKKITEEDLLKRGFERTLDNYYIEDIKGLDFYYRTDNNTVDISDSHNKMHCGCCITVEAEYVCELDNICKTLTKQEFPKKTINFKY